MDAVRIASGKPRFSEVVDISLASIMSLPNQNPKINNLSRRSLSEDGSFLQHQRVFDAFMPP